MTEQEVFKYSTFELNDQFISEYNMTRGKLESYFNLVKNPQNWKLPIDSICEMKDVANIESAIIFFTGSVPSFKPSATLTGKYIVKADGYYAAVGA